jgi:putative holliday junction resolvase
VVGSLRELRLDERGLQPLGHCTANSKDQGLTIISHVSDARELPHRVLGLDVGSKTIGMAVSDPLGITAQGLSTLRRKNKRSDLSALAEVVRRYEVREIVVGYPLRMSGAEGTQSEKMARFAGDLRKHFGLPVHLWDERLTSAEANRVLRESEMSIKRRGEVVDQLAAVLILQSWMEASRQS